MSGRRGTVPLKCLALELAPGMSGGGNVGVKCLQKMSGAKGLVGQMLGVGIIQVGEYFLWDSDSAVRKFQKISENLKLRTQTLA